MLLDAPAVRRTLSDARLARLAIDTGRGPTIVPVVFTTHDDRVWLVVPRASVKAKSLRKRPQCAVLIDDGSTAVVIRGRAHIVDPFMPLDSLSEARRIPPAMGSYVTRNLRHLTGLLGSPSTALLAPRVAVSVVPEDVEIIEGFAANAAVALDGPIALPGRWDESASTIELPRDVADGPVAVTVDNEDEVRGRTFRGQLRSGTVDVERIIEWEGMAAA